MALLTLDVKDTRLTQTYSLLPASWTGDTHEETDFLPISDREGKSIKLLDRRSDNLGATSTRGRVLCG